MIEEKNSISKSGVCRRYKNVDTMRNKKNKCNWFEKLKEFNIIINLTPDVKEMLNIKNCKDKIGLYNEKTHMVMIGIL